MCYLDLGYFFGNVNDDKTNYGSYYGTDNDIGNKGGGIPRHVGSHKEVHVKTIQKTNGSTDIHSFFDGDAVMPWI